jgi:hypothetical protein
MGRSRMWLRCGKCRMVIILLLLLLGHEGDGRCFRHHHHHCQRPDGLPEKEEPVTTP